MKNLIDLSKENFFNNNSNIENNVDFGDDADVIELLNEVENNSKNLKLDLLDNEDKVVNINFNRN